MNTPELPTHLGGLQHLQPDVIAKADDVYVRDGVPRGFVKSNAGEKVETLERALEFNVYRRIPVAKQGDNDDTGWKRVAAQAADPMTPVPVSPKAATYDDGKPPLACLPLKALREVALVQLYGHKKYGDFYNYKKGMEVSRNASCAMRHIADYMDGHDLDTESKRNHLAHAACRLLFILENLADGTAVDDRYKKQ